MPHPRRRLANCVTTCAGGTVIIEQLLPKLDGIYLPGSPSNVSRTYMVKTAMSLTPIPGVIFEHGVN